MILTLVDGALVALEDCRLDLLAGRVVGRQSPGVDDLVERRRFAVVEV